jgi:tetratricopeptide (TPR) repeat protein
MRLDLLSTLASLYQAKHAYEQSIRRLKQGIIIAKQLKNAAWLAKFWGTLGSIYLDLGQSSKAVRAYWKAIRFNPQDASLWVELRQTYLTQGRVESARSVLKKAAMVEPLDKNT